MDTIINKINNGNIDKLTVKELETILTQASESYYNEGITIISDEIFDILKEKLRKLAPKNIFLKQVGAPENERDAIELPYWMGSLDKIRDDEKSLDKWKTKYSGSYVISDKLDGNSGLLVYNKGKQFLYSRGNGYKGQNLNHLLPYLKFPNINNSAPIAIRGELIISKENWEKIKHLGANARNVVAGILHSKVPNPEIAKYIEFVAYSLIVPKLRTNAAFLDLESKGFKVAYHTRIQTPENLTMPKLSELLMLRRSQSPYEVDGIVVEYDDIHKIIKGRNPKYAFAFKSILTHDEAEAVVTSVEWNLSKDGFIKPTVLINPINLNGVKISRVTGYNGSYIENNRIGPGAKVIIIRSGDVIPKIIRVVLEVTPQMPTIPYKWNDTHIDLIISKKGDIELNNEIIIRNLEHFCKILEIKYVSTGIITKLVNNGINNIPKLLKVSVQDLLKIEGFQKTSAEKIHKSINDTIDRISKDDKLCVQLMSASNLFGRSLGTKKIQLFVDKYPSIIRENIPLTVGDLIKIKGIAEITAKAFLEGISKYHELLKEIGIKCNSTKEISEEKKETKIPSNISIVFTGFRNKEWEKLISDAGSSVKTSISKNTDLVVVNNINEKSSKLEKAKELNIKILSKDQFEKQYLL